MKSKRIILLFFIAASINHFPQLKNGENIYHKNWVAKSGCWDFSNKTIKAQGFIRQNIAYYNSKIFKDFLYEVEINKINEGGTFGLLFRYDEINDNGYVVQYWPDKGCKFLSIGKGADWTEICNINQPINQLVGNNVWNKIKIIAKGSKIKIFLNDHLQDTIIDTTYQYGRLGLFLAADPRQISLFRIIKMEPK